MTDILIKKQKYQKLPSALFKIYTCNMNYKVFPIKLLLHVYIVTHVHEHLVWLVVRLITQ